MRELRIASHFITLTLIKCHQLSVTKAGRDQSRNDCLSLLMLYLEEAFVLKVQILCVIVEMTSITSIVHERFPSFKGNKLPVLSFVPMLISGSVHQRYRDGYHNSYPRRHVMDAVHCCAHCHHSHSHMSSFSENSTIESVFAHTSLGKALGMNEWMDERMNVWTVGVVDGVSLRVDSLFLLLASHYYYAALMPREKLLSSKLDCSELSLKNVVQLHLIEIELQCQSSYQPQVELYRRSSMILHVWYSLAVEIKTLDASNKRF